MSDANANKEKWAAKNQGRTLHPDQVAAQQQSRSKVPPGQHIPKNWPRLDLGFIPEVPIEKWRLRVSGLVEKPQEWSIEEFMKLPQSEQVADMHCVTTWSVLDSHFAGVKFRDLAKIVGVKPEAKFVYFTSYDGYSTNLDLEGCMDDDVMVIHSWNKKPLTPDHGCPVRMLIPKRYLWKSAKWVRQIEFIPQDRLGYWELRGYHNHADPWTEERFS
ncbi:MAG TPA: sulfite oxidase-like oxidoreductase [Planctomycetota bacterium]|nr:sulfite oxidase-like oxidoreductase [Planctomycetota bacterium]